MNKFLSFAILSIFCLMLSSTSALAQATGSFNRTITFAGLPRTLSLYVPPTYNASSPARLMVCLHGLGDNSVAYRNALINSLAMQNTFTNTIFVCPDGGSDQIKDFYTPVGDQFIIDSAIAYVADSYAIDQSYMILQGFSLGGRSALRYGLTYPGMFKGLLLNTPAIQGCKEAVFPGGYAYANATGMPIYISHGATDEIYSNPIDSTVLMLVNNDANMRMNRVAGLGHNIPTVSQMQGLDTFFDAQAAVQYDIELSDVRTPVRTCQAAYNVSCIFRNMGSQPVTSVEFEYTINSTTATTSWTGNLASFEHATLLIPTTATTSANDIIVKVLTINGTIPDAVTGNNTKQTSYTYAMTPASLPYTQDFEAATFPADWVHITAGDIMSSLDLDNTVGYNSANSMFSFNSILVFDNSGRRENIYTPVLDLTGTTIPELTFDVSFNYHHFEPPVATAAFDLSDTLEVSASADCGATWQVLYRKAGADLATFTTPILNPVSLQAAAQVPTAADWRNERVALAPVAGNNDVIVRISYISGLGGWINLDNVNVTPTTDVAETVKDMNFEVFPNPAHEQVTVQCSDDIESITVTDMQGRVVATTKPAMNSRSVAMQTGTWTPGVYMVQLHTAHGNAVRKLVVD